MCGISGIISKQNAFIQIDALHRMLGAMIHRGPDGQGEYHDEQVVMGMRRLSIIDLEGGWQPLYSEDKSLVLIVNGEIYNYLELSEELKKRGHVFATNSDCEVILHLYEEEQESCLHHLRGMFAFALLDKKKGTVFIG